MILVDSSILIGYFKGLKGDPYDKLDTFIENEIPFGISNHIYQEVLQGSKNEKEFKLLREYLDTVDVYDLLYGKKSYEHAALMYYKCRKAGITPRSTIDMIIAQTAVQISKIIRELKLL